ncbi:MAG TPA: hypothetical protein VG796_24810 [Verrucomicrobiales bacterium]|nr:hypothetical protein [Verrucomicrobiales bacterium]
MSRIGKIASLPRPFREELNHRMDRNVPARILAERLNSLPEVQALLRDSFDGNPINEQNLCNWRQGGFQEWQTRREFLERLQLFSESAADIESAASGMADYAASLLSIHFATAMEEFSFGSSSAQAHPTHTLTLTLTHTPSEQAPLPASEPAASPIHDSTIHDSSPTPPPHPHSSIIHSQLSPLKPLYALARAVSSLRRGDHSAARLKLQQQAAARAAAKVSSSEPASQGPRIFNPPRQPEPLLTSLPANPFTSPRPAAPASENQGKSSLFSFSQSSSPAPLSILYSPLSLPPILPATVPTHTHTLTPNPAKPELKCGPEAQPDISRGCSEGTERNPRIAKGKGESPGRGDRIEKTPNIAANRFVARTEGVTPAHTPFHPSRSSRISTINSPRTPLSPPQTVFPIPAVPTPVNQRSS